MTNSAIATAQASSVPAAVLAAGMKPYSIPRRINQGGRERLVALGVEIGGQRDFQYLEGQIPDGWSVRDTTVSPWQKRMFDGDDNLVAQLFYKPCAGTPSINVLLTEEEAAALASAVPAAAQESSVPAAVAAGTQPYSIPRRINQGGRERLIALGVVIGEQRDFQYLDAQFPASWSVRDTAVSPWQKRIFDGNDNLVAQLFYKPCGGTPSINVFLTEDEAKAVLTF